MACAVAGGSWLFVTLGEPKTKAPLGPVLKEDGTLDPQRLEPCPEEEAVAYATEKPNEVKLK